MMIIFILLIVISGYVLYVYNSLAAKGNIIKNSESDIAVQLKRRFDLVDNLVNTVKGSANFEKEALEKVVTARNSAFSGSSAGDESSLEEGLSLSLKSLFALSENYPDLKSNASFVELQNELSSLEESIQSARRYFNATIREYNHLIVTVPSNFIARIFGFSEYEYFKISQDQKENVKVSF